MSLRNTEIAAVFTRFLERYTPPASFRDNPRAVQDEADALLAVLLKYAPASLPLPWVNRVIDQLEYQLKTRAWPTKQELGAVCVNTRKEDARQAPHTFGIVQQRSDVEITAARMRSSAPVGENWLYGRLACELEESGLVTPDLIAEYRKGAFFARKDVYGEEKARAWEVERRAWHDSFKKSNV